MNPSTFPRGAQLLRPRLKWRLLATLAGVLAATCAHAGRPLATDDASVLEAGSCHLESWLEHTPDGRAFWAMPACSPLAGVELAIGGARSHRDGEPAATIGAWQVKTVWQQVSESQPGYGLALGGQHVRGGAGSTELKGIASWPLRGDALLLHTNLGWLRARDGELDERQNHATWAVALDSALGERTRASLESLGTSGQRAAWQAGLSYALVPDRIQIDASVGSAFGRWRGTRSFTLGMVFTTASFLK
jgi:hypothetical protein